MSDRFKDFSESLFSYDGPTILEIGPVSVQILSWKSTLEYEELRKKNDDSVSKYLVADNSNLPKIPWGISYEGVPVGEITVWSIDMRNRMCKISYWVDSDYRRKGIASAAIAAVCDQMFESLDMEEIEAPIVEDNEPSKNLVQSLFFNMAGYEVLADKNGALISHEIYLQRKPEGANQEMGLIDYVLDKYESLRS